MKLEYDELLSSLAFNFNLRRYMVEKQKMDTEKVRDDLKRQIGDLERSIDLARGLFIDWEHKLDRFFIPYSSDSSNSCARKSV